MPFTIERNDLALVEADAIVIAANEQLQITGGVGLTVAQAAGLEKLQAACDAIGFCPCGSAVSTPAFDLPAKVVVHAVGPVWHGGGQGEADFLRSAYDAALECAAAEGARSIALPLISAGTYGFPADVSLAVSREAIRTFLNRYEDVYVRLVLYSPESVAAGMSAYLEIAEYIDGHYVDEFGPWGNMRSSMDGHSEPRVAASCEYAPAAPKARGRRGLLDRLSSAVDHAWEHRHESQEDAERLPPYEQAEAGEASGSEAEPVPEEAYYAAASPAAAEPFLEPAYYTAAAPTAAEAPAPAMAPASSESLEDLLNSLDAPFSETLLALIDQRGMTDVQVYKRANMSRQLFSKIRSDAGYRPTKKTALALAIALGLDLDETSDLLARAGFALSSSSKGDVIVEYFIQQGNYDIFEINEALYAFDQPLL